MYSETIRSPRSCSTGCPACRAASQCHTCNWLPFLLIISIDLPSLTPIPGKAPEPPQSALFLLHYFHPSSTLPLQSISKPIFLAKISPTVKNHLLLSHGHLHSVPIFIPCPCSSGAHVYKMIIFHRLCHKFAKFLALYIPPFPGLSDVSLCYYILPIIMSFLSLFISLLFFLYCCSSCYYISLYYYIYPSDDTYVFHYFISPCYNFPVTVIIFSSLVYFAPL